MSKYQVLSKTEGTIKLRTYMLAPSYRGKLGALQRVIVDTLLVGGNGCTMVMDYQRPVILDIQDVPKKKDAIYVTATAEEEVLAECVLDDFREAMCAEIQQAQIIDLQKAKEKLKKKGAGI